MKNKYQDRYAKFYEDAIERRGEVTNEEFWIYFLIVFYSFVTEDGLRVCEKSVQEICDLNDLEYANTTHRVLRLRTGTFGKKEPVKKVAQMKTPWLYKTKAGHFLPLVGVKEMVKNTIFMEKEMVKNTISNGKKYHKSSAKNGKKYHSLIPYIQTSLNEDLSTTTETETVVVVDTEVGLSKFSKEECLRYAQISKDNGDPIRSVNAVARHAYLTGESDIYIQATLYPEKPDEPPADDARSDALNLLREVEADGFDVLDYKKWYSEEDWQWLMAQLAK